MGVYRRISAALLVLSFPLGPLGLLGAGYARAGAGELAELKAVIASRNPAHTDLDDLRPSDAPVDAQLRDNRLRMKRSRELERLSKAAAKLTAREKAELARALDRKYPSRTQAPFFLRLAVEDADAWHELFERSMHPQGITRLPMLREYRPMVSSLGEPVRSRLFAGIAAQYPTAVKYDLKTNIDLTYYVQKRVLDAWLRALIPVEPLLADAKRKGASGAQVYKSYRRLLEENLLLPHADKLKAYSKLAPEHVLEIARIIQGVLRDFNYPDSALEMYGSVVKGLETAGSDIDLKGYVGLGNARGENLRQVRGEWTSVIKSISDRVNGYLESNGIRLGLKVEPIKPGALPKEDGLVLDPFRIEIKPGSIRLKVFSERIHALPLHTSVAPGTPLPELSVEHYRVGTIRSLPIPKCSVPRLRRSLLAAD